MMNKSWPGMIGIPDSKGLHRANQYKCKTILFGMVVGILILFFPLSGKGEQTTPFELRLLTYNYDLRSTVPQSSDPSKAFEDGIDFAKGWLRADEDTARDIASHLLEYQKVWCRYRT